jgi:hypothetical protein
MHMVSLTSQATHEDVYDQVEINPFVYQHWVDALGEFAASVRIRNGLQQVVSIDEESWHLNDAGDLVISASIDKEMIQMIVPRGLWEWL